MRITILAYPFLFGILPILAIYGANPGFWMLPELIGPLLFAGAIVALFVTIFGIILRDYDKAAVISSILVTACFCFVYFKAIINELFISYKLASPPFAALAIYVLIFTPFLCLFAKSEFKLGRHTIPINLKSARLKLNILAALMVGITAYQIIDFELKQKILIKKITANSYWRDKTVRFGNIHRKPDIYYIIFDAYANAKTFSKYYCYDNSNFIAFLKKQGFYVATKSCSNHDRTALSIPSSLNMQYLTCLKTELGDDYIADSVPNYLMQHSQIMHLLKDQGYKFVNVCTSWPPTAFIPSADFNIGCSINGYFPLAVLGVSIFSELEPQFHFIRNLYAQNKLCLFHRVQELKSITGPKFVLAHCLLTHPPFIFNSKGEKLPVLVDNLTLNQPYDPRKYIDQVKFAESLFKPLIHNLVNQNPKPIIILQSDHGPATVPAVYSYSSLGERHKYINARMRILNAYFLPENSKIKPYESISPVNTFRLILNSYFNTNLDMLPDESYLSFADERRFRFRNVTKDIDFEEKN